MSIAVSAYVHEKAVVEPGASVGPNTRVWAFAHILPGAVIGAECNICDHVFIENQVRIGDRVTIKCGVQVWDGITLEDDVFVGPNATLTNDRFPRSKHYLNIYPQTVVRQGASIGANATTLPGITIGRDAVVGAGAVVTPGRAQSRHRRRCPSAHRGMRGGTAKPRGTSADAEVWHLRIPFAPRHLSAVRC